MLQEILGFFKEWAYIIGPALIVVVLLVWLITGKIKKTRVVSTPATSGNETPISVEQPPGKIPIKEIAVYVLIVAVLAAVTLPAFTTYVWLEGFQTTFHVSFIFSALFFILAEIMMLKIYNEKARLEQQAWHGWYVWLNSFAPALDQTAKKFQATYRDSIWVKYTPPYALVSYLVISSVGLTAFIYHFNRLVEEMGWPYALWLAALLAFVIINLNVKFVNDLYNLITKYRQAKALLKQLHLSEH